MAVPSNPSDTVPDAPGGGEPILAAGCVLWRRDQDGGVRVAVVRRPKYDDWSHPKGKLHRGEESRAAALREVREETGMACRLGPELSVSRYLVDGRPKEVRYWAAEATGGAFAPNDEVDRLLWLAPEEARATLTRPRDVELVDELLRRLPPPPG
ncbi:NUDIX hydrolase [Streptomyces durbertensis]|uniref:NUDIX hydrolase n=1 Tax=Streptomyces durbertensis TaxID=2448886 RepID=A0ABR6EFN8_9ACTN|nr:NUDIX hydrolase [Streptomyces durbertensis]MBB1243284.1 NUDIX hydrolase [Streptomyces durbertensis]